MSRKTKAKTINSPIKKAIAGYVTTSESENEEPVVEPKTPKKKSSGRPKDTVQMVQILYTLEENHPLFEKQFSRIDGGR